MRTVLFDLDGTLADSAALITEHLAEALAHVGAPVPAPDVLRTLVGPPFETALPPLGLTPAQTAAAIARYRAGYDAVAGAHTPLFPGVPALLETLGDAGYRLALATSKPETTAAKIVAGTGTAGAFALVGGAEPASGRVGKAAVVGSVLARLGIDPRTEPTVMVGDRHHDVDGAAEHGVATIGVGWGYAEPGELAGARRIATDLDDLLTILETEETIWSA
jgi:phosphoglycolate phosphatase